MTKISLGTIIENVRNIGMFRDHTGKNVDMRSEAFLPQQVLLCSNKCNHPLPLMNTQGINSHLQFILALDAA